MTHTTRLRDGTKVEVPESELTTRRLRWSITSFAATNGIEKTKLYLKAWLDALDDPDNINRQIIQEMIDQQGGIDETSDLPDNPTE